MTIPAGPSGAALTRADLLAARPGASPRRSWLLPILAAVFAGAAVVALSPLGAFRQAAVVVLVGVGLPLAGLFLARPHVGVAAFLLLIPLMTSSPVLAGLNSGELLTAGVLLLGAGSLWEARDRIGPALRSLGWIVWPLLGLAAVSLLSLIANGIGDFGEILGGMFKFVAFAVVAVLVHMHATTRGRAETMLRAAMVGALLVAAYAIIAYVLGWSYEEKYDWNRARGTFELYNTMAGYMVLMSMTTLGMAAIMKRSALRLFFVVVFLFEITAMLLSLSLAAVVALAGGAVVALLFMARIPWSRIVAGAIAFGVAFSAVLIVTPALADKFTRIDERVIDRIRSYQVGLAMFRDKFLLGFGTQERMLDALWFGDANYGITSFGQSSSLPHNSLLMMGVEKGFTGVILFSLLLAGAVVLMVRHARAFRGTRYAPLFTGFLVSLFSFLIYNMANNLVLHSRLGIVFFALLAIVVRLAELAGRADTGVVESS